MNSTFEYAIFTNAGGRETNEDAVDVCNQNGNFCFVLCDGLGGHGMGDTASSLVVKNFNQMFLEGKFSFVEFLDNAFTKAQERLMQEQKVKLATHKMKTTCVAAVTDEKNIYIGHVGDSRAYIFSKNKIKFRTLDHSIPQMLVMSREIKESEIRHHPDRNLLLKVMGVDWEEPMYEIAPSRPIKKTQAFLLCSDGFWEFIDEKEMCELLKKADSVTEWLFDMVETVKKNGKGHDMDNFSAIAVWKI